MGLIQNIIGTFSNVFSIGKTNKATLTSDANGLNIDKKTLVPNLKIGTLGGILKGTSGDVSGSATATDLPFTPVGNLTSTNVQNVIKEVYDELGKIVGDFSYTDFVSGYISIGNTYNGYFVDKVVIEVESAFDEGTITVGDALTADLFTVAGDSELTVPNLYEKASSFQYSYNSDIRIAFSGNPTQGSGRVIVYLK